MDLVIDHVSHRQPGGLAVLDDVTLHVHSGEIVVVLGPSGCGKSTLLRIVGGLEQPTAGAVFTRGRPAPSTLNALTYIFQDFALLPWRSVADNVALPLEHQPMPETERRRRVAEALQRVNLAEFAHAFPMQLSGGMRQRTGIARALAVDPAVLLMDEPLSGLDAQTRDLLLEDLVRLWHESRFTAVYVTHSLSEALWLGHRIVVLSRRPGRIREIIEVEEPIGTRGPTNPALLAIREHIWRLVRNEAAWAERELVDGP
jgi:NitT/TauT family transport system ATP-binding protein